MHLREDIGRDRDKRNQKRQKDLKLKRRRDDFYDDDDDDRRRSKKRRRAA